MGMGGSHLFLKCIENLGILSWRKLPRHQYMFLPRGMAGCFCSWIPPSLLQWDVCSEPFRKCRAPVVDLLPTPLCRCRLSVQPSSTTARCASGCLLCPAAGVSQVGCVEEHSPGCPPHPWVCPLPVSSIQPITSLCMGEYQTGWWCFFLLRDNSVAFINDIISYL